MGKVMSLTEFLDVFSKDKQIELIKKEVLERDISDNELTMAYYSHKQMMENCYFFAILTLFISFIHINYVFLGVILMLVFLMFALISSVQHDAIYEISLKEKRVLNDTDN